MVVPLLWGPLCCRYPGRWHRDHTPYTPARSARSWYCRRRCHRRHRCGYGYCRSCHPPSCRRYGARRCSSHPRHSSCCSICCISRRCRCSSCDSRCCWWPSSEVALAVAAVSAVAWCLTAVDPIAVGGALCEALLVGESNLHISFENQ